MEKFKTWFARGLLFAFILFPIFYGFGYFIGVGGSPDTDIQEESIVQEDTVLEKAEVTVTEILTPTNTPTPSPTSTPIPTVTNTPTPQPTATPTAKPKPIKKAAPAVKGMDYPLEMAVSENFNFKRAGVVMYDGWRWTYYSDKVLPGGGLKIPGRHYDAKNFICDENDYICLASSVIPKGTVMRTPFGKWGKIYDCGCRADTVDVYVHY